MKGIKRILLGSVAALLLINGNGVVAEAAEPTVEESVTVMKGAKTLIDITEDNCYVFSKTFKTTNKNIATVNKDGVVTAKKVGSCNIKGTLKYEDADDNTDTEKSKVVTIKVKVTKRVKKNATDVKVLNKIIKQQKKSKVSKDLDSEQYIWNAKGRLVEIDWEKKNTGGKISFSGLKKLEKLKCGDGSAVYDYKIIKSLDVSDCTSLKYLDCSYIVGLESLNVKGCKNLEYLNCQGTGVKSLNLSGYKNLKIVDCANWGLESLDVSDCTSLESLYCSDGESPQKLSSLNVSGCTNLETLVVEESRLTTLDVSGNKALKYFYWDRNNDLEVLNVSGCTALTNLIPENNQFWGFFSEIDASGCTALKSVDLSEDNDVYMWNMHKKNAKLNFSGCTSLESFNCTGLCFSTLSMNFSGCTELKKFECSRKYDGSCEEMNLNFSGCTALKDVKCSLAASNAFEMNVSGCTALETIDTMRDEYKGGRYVLTYDVSDCVNLNTLMIDENTTVTGVPTGCVIDKEWRGYDDEDYDDEDYE